MKRGKPQPSDELKRSKCSTNKCRNKSSMYQKAGLATSGVRVVTRSKARAAAEAAVDSRHRCSETVVDARTSLHTPDACESTSASSDMPVLQQHTLVFTPTASRAGQRVTKHTSTSTPGMTHFPIALSGGPSAPVAQQYSKSLASSLQQQPADDLRQLDVAFAGGRFIHPSLLQHAGVSTSKQLTKRQQRVKVAEQSPVRLSTAADYHGAEQQLLHQQPASSGKVGTNGPQSKAGRRVAFAPGPLDPQQHCNCTPDGHPAAEGVQAVPVRRVSPSYALDLTKGNVLFLENLLGTECQMSVTRLKRRVGLLPPTRPSRPYIGARRGWQEEDAGAAQNLQPPAAAEAQAVSK